MRTARGFSSLILILLLVMVLAGLAFFVVSRGSGPASCSQPFVVGAPSTEFANPEPVTIQGYSGSAEEPYLTPDGQYLLFGDRTDTQKDPNIFYAKRVDDTTFTFVGEVTGVNTPDLEAAPNMDDLGTFYFTSVRSYGKSGEFNTTYRGVWNNGTVTGVHAVPGISDQKRGMLDMDAQISPDGNTLYVSSADFSRGLPPRSSIVKIAVKNPDGSFTKTGNWAELLENINVCNLTYAPNISRDGLVLFFNHADPAEGSMRIYLAKRGSVSEPFGVPQLVEATGDRVESAFLSSDGNRLYYHQALEMKEGGISKFGIYMLTRQKD
jgi:hypothetical protein